MNNPKFKIGDKVVRNWKDGRQTLIGTIINITPKRGDVVVDYGNFKEKYRSDGWQKGGDVWTRSTIELLTPEIEEQIRRFRLIRKCRDTFDKKKDLSVDQAARILEILNE